MNDMSFEVLHQSRRAALAERLAVETGINDLMIEVLVRRFYEKVRANALLGLNFQTRIRDWESHLKDMCDFWSSVALITGRYHGTPMAKHLPLPVDAEHFDRWLALFEETAREICPPKAADHFIERARRITESLEIGIAGFNGSFLARGQRYRFSPVA
jgi:hemoglobin